MSSSTTLPNTKVSADDSQLVAHEQRASFSDNICDVESRHKRSDDAFNSDPAFDDLLLKALGVVRPLYYVTGALPLPLPHALRYFRRLMVGVHVFLAIMRIVSIVIGMVAAGRENQRHARGSAESDELIMTIMTDLTSVWGYSLCMWLYYHSLRTLFSLTHPAGLRAVLVDHLQRLPEGPKRMHAARRMNTHMLWTGGIIYICIIIISGLFSSKRLFASQDDYCAPELIICPWKRRTLTIPGWFAFEATTEFSWCSLFSAFFVSYVLLFRIQRLTINQSHSLQRKATMRRIRDMAGPADEELARSVVLRHRQNQARTPTVMLTREGQDNGTVVVPGRNSTSTRENNAIVSPQGDVDIDALEKAKGQAMNPLPASDADPDDVIVVDDQDETRSSASDSDDASDISDVSVISAIDLSDLALEQVITSAALRSSRGSAGPGGRGTSTGSTHLTPKWNSTSDIEMTPMGGDSEGTARYYKGRGSVKQRKSPVSGLCTPAVYNSQTDSPALSISKGQLEKRMGSGARGKLIIRTYTPGIAFTALCNVIWPVMLALAYAFTTTETVSFLGMLIVGPVGLAWISPSCLQLWLLIKASHVSMVRLGHLDQQFVDPQGVRIVRALMQQVKRTVHKTLSVMREYTGMFLWSSCLSIVISVPSMIFLAVASEHHMNLYLQGAPLSVMAQHQPTRYWFAFIGGPVVGFFPVFMVWNTCGTKGLGKSFKVATGLYLALLYVYHPLRYLLWHNTAVMRVSGFAVLGVAFAFCTLYLYKARPHFQLHRNYATSTVFLLGFTALYVFAILNSYAKAKNDKERIFIRLFILPVAQLVLTILGRLMYSSARYNPKIANTFGVPNAIGLALVVVNRFLIVGISNLEQEIIISILFALVEVALRATLPLRTMAAIMLRRRTTDWASVITQADIMSKDEVTCHQILLSMFNELVAIVVSCLFVISYGLFHNNPGLVTGGLVSLGCQLFIEIVCDVVSFRFEEGILKVPLRDTLKRYYGAYLLNVGYNSIAVICLFIEFFSISIANIAQQTTPYSVTVE